MESGLQLEGLLSNLMTNPELLSKVLSMAGKLAEGVSGFNVNQGADTPPSVEKSELLPAPVEGKRSDMHKHKKLVEALMLYVSEEKRPKLEMILKILEIVELAEALRG